MKGESRGLCERGEQTASPSPLCAQAPMLANSTQCLSIEPFVAQKEGPAYSYRQEWRPGKEGLRRPDTGKYRLKDSRLHLPLLGQEDVGVAMSKSVFLAWAQLPSALCVANLPPPGRQFRGRSSASE